MIKKISSAIFKTLILSLMVIADLHFAFAQSTTQGLIPNGKATFLDQNGKPLTSGKVYFYIPNTTTPKTTYQDINGTVANTNPVVLDAAGRALLWGTGNYRQQVFDKNNNLIWDVTTSTAGAGGGGGAIGTGDGDAVGTIKPWAGAIPPNQYLFTYGQELSRTTYAPLFQAITSIQSINCTSGSPTISGLSNTDSFWIGMKVELPCVSGGVSTLISKTSFTVTLANNANINGISTATFFMWGNGNGSSTFNLPDFRGLIPMGNNIMGGVASSNMSATYFGATSPNSAGALGGNQTATLSTVNLPPYTPAGFVNTSTSVTSTVTQVQSTVNGGTGSFGTNSAAGTVQNLAGILGISLSSTSTFTGTAQGGTSTPFGIIQPSRTTNFIIKVTPDSSFSGTGVTTIGGMSGDIACGGGLVCAGSTISVISAGAGGTNGQIQYNNAGALGGYNKTGTGTNIASSLGALNTGNCVQIDPNGNFIDAGSPCAASFPVLRVITASGAVTVLNTDGTVVVNKTAIETTTVNLPASPTTGKIFNIKDGKCNGGTQPYTFVPASGLIDNQSTYVMQVNCGAIGLVYNGTQWNIL